MHVQCPHSGIKSYFLTRRGYLCTGYETHLTRPRVYRVSCILHIFNLLIFLKRHFIVVQSYGIWLTAMICQTGKNLLFLKCKRYCNRAVYSILQKCFYCNLCIIWDRIVLHVFTHERNTCNNRRKRIRAIVWHWQTLKW